MNDSQEHGIDKYANAISDENTLESNINNRPPVKFTNDPKYIKEFKKPTKEFEENYAIISMIGSDDVYHNFDVFCVDKFVKSYLENKWTTGIRVIANKYNQIFLENMNRKINDLENTIISKFEDNKESTESSKVDETSSSKVKNDLLAKITNVKEYLMTIYNAVKLNDNLPEDTVKQLVKTECNVSYDDIESEYHTFHDEHLDKLQEDFRKIEDYQGPIISAFKIRGIHDTVDAAKEHAKKLYDLEPYVDTYVANVGQWASWTASREYVQDVVYMDKSLDKLMKRYKENINKCNTEFDERRKASIEQSKMARKEEIRRKINKQQ